jgi:hypothetical protein
MPLGISHIRYTSPIPPPPALAESLFSLSRHTSHVTRHFCNHHANATAHGLPFDIHPHHPTPGMKLQQQLSAKMGPHRADRFAEPMPRRHPHNDKHIVRIRFKVDSPTRGHGECVVSRLGPPRQAALSQQREIKQNLDHNKNPIQEVSRHRGGGFAIYRHRTPSLCPCVQTWPLRSSVAGDPRAAETSG